jgi:N utilization substance protein A
LVEEDNIKLAGLLTGYELTLFRRWCSWCYCWWWWRWVDWISDEIEDWVIEEFAKIGLILQKYLEQDVEDLVRRTDLEEETILDVMRILKKNLTVSQQVFNYKHAIY